MLGLFYIFSLDAVLVQYAKLLTSMAYVTKGWEGGPFISANGK
jgi:hypothetical protein